MFVISAFTTVTSALILFTFFSTLTTLALMLLILEGVILNVYSISLDVSILSVNVLSNIFYF